MKILILVLSFLIFSNGLSQIITVDINSTEIFFKRGKYDSIEPLKFTNEESVFSSVGSIKKVINLNEMEALIYDNNNLIKTLRIKNCQVNNGVYFITIDDINLIDNNQLDTFQIIDTQNKSSYYCWIYNNLNENWVISEEVENLTVK